MGEDVQINFRIHAAQKQDWDDFVEESDRFRTLSSLIRTAVSKEMSDDDAAASAESPAVSNDLNEIKSDLERVRNDVRWLREQKQDATDISDLANEVFESLRELPDSPVSAIPDEVDDPKTFKQREAAQQVIRPNSEDDTHSPQTARAIADRLDAKPSDVRDAIDHLQDQFLPVVELHRIRARASISSPLIQAHRLAEAESITS